MPYPGYYAHFREELERMIRELDSEEEMKRSEGMVDSDYVSMAIGYLYDAKMSLLKSETRDYAEDQEKGL